LTYVEGEFLELKREMTSDLAKEIVAFANTKGGKILIGVEDSGEVVGVADAKKICEGLSSYIRDTINPDISTMISISVEDFFENEIVVIDVLRGTERPYYLAKKGLHPNGVFVRLGNTSVPVSEFAIRQMLLETGGVNYEDLVSFNQDLHFDYAKKFLSGHGLTLDERAMKSLGIMDLEGFFTNLAFVISDESTYNIKIGVFKDEKSSEFLDRKEFGGSIFEQLTEAFKYLQLCNRIKGTYEGLYRIDSPEYDDSALREALLNLLIHRDYSVSGSNLIKIFSDRAEFLSFGGLVSGLTVEDVLSGVSKQRNEKLANIFYRIELIESFGTGVSKIFDTYEKHPVKPQILPTPGAFKLILPNRNYVIKPVIYKHSKTDEGSKFKETEEFEDERTQKVLDLLFIESRLSRKEIQERLGLKQTSCIMLLNKLEEQGLIKRMNKGKNTKYLVRKGDYA